MIPPGVQPAWLAKLLLCCALVAGGCASQDQWVSVRETPHNPFATRFDQLTSRGPRPSPRTQQLLRKYNLLGQLKGDRGALIAQIDDLKTPATCSEHHYAMAELAYLGATQAKDRDPDRATELYGTALLNAHDYLFTSEGACQPNAYDPQFRGACDLYNQSLEGLLRLVAADGQLRPGDRRTLKTAHHLCSFDIVMRSTGWHAEDLDRVAFVSDFRINGLRNHYHTYGLGVPLIAVRRRHDDQQPGEKYLPQQLAFPLTAFLRVNARPTRDGRVQQVAHSAEATGAAGATTPAASPPAFVLELRDPLDEQTLQVRGRRAPLESDLSTPLAYFLNLPALSENTISTLGLLRPDSVKPLQGLYMLEPYNPHKMPVLMVHGLWSSPVTWMEMFNDLRSDPNLRDRYQFWFYLYPSGQPFWESAAQLRADLAKVRNDLDPGRRSPALDQMVLVGHSMGGLVSRMQSVDSKQLFWQANTDRRFAELRADDDARRELAETYFFRPNASVRRVVTIGTPHRGSQFANDVTGWLGRKLIDVPMRVMRGRRELFAQNPGFFRHDSPVASRNSIESLDPESPLLNPLLTAPPGPWVAYHNIVGRAPESGLRKVIGSDGDGVVSLASARLEGTPQLASQLVVPADHLTVHRHPQSILEVRRILLEQIAELDAPVAQGQIQLVRQPQQAGNQVR